MNDYSHLTADLPDESGEEHTVTVYSALPPHSVIRTYTCKCSRNAAHTTTEGPKSSE